MFTDRFVVGSFQDAERGMVEIVRYDRGGKYYIEPAKARRKHVTIGQAAAALVEAGDAGTWNEGRYGGSAFDRAVRKLREGQA